MLSPVSSVGTQTPSTAPQQEEEACDGGAPSGSGSQTPAKWSGAPGSFPGHITEGKELILILKEAAVQIFLKSCPLVALKILSGA